MADAKIVNIKGVQWDLKDEVARKRIAELEKLISELQKENEVKELYNLTVGKNVAFVGSVMKKGKLIIISGLIVLSEKPTEKILGNLPINKSASEKDCIINWIDNSANSLGTSLLHLGSQKNEMTLVAGYPNSYNALGQINISYVTE